MTKTNYPLISVAITTFNSEKSLEISLSSIRKQSYPQNKVEVLIIDGGSIDKTFEISKKYKCRIIKNPGTDVIFRKQLGYLKARGKYLVYLDSDESLENPQSLKLKYSVFIKNPQVKAVISDGARSPNKGSFINDYINEFGDPFSFYLYREAKSDKFLIKEWRKKYQVLYEDEHYITFNLEGSNASLIELWAGGCMIDLKYSKATFPSVKKNPTQIALLYYLLKSKGKLLAITKKDTIIHDSSPSFKKYLKKISSRIKNNVFQTEMGIGGYSGREEYQSRYYYYKKFFYPLYAFLMIPAIVDSITLSISKKRISYLIHFPLTLYTAAIISYFMALKLLRLNPKVGTYGS